MTEFYICGVCGKRFEEKDGIKCSNGQIACSIDHAKQIEKCINQNALPIKGD